MEVLKETPKVKKAKKIITKVENPVKNIKRESLILKILFYLSLLFIIGFGVWGYKSGIFNSKSDLIKYINSTGVWGSIIFIIVQIVQVVIPIIPGGITSIVGVIIFGALKGTFYNYIGILIGSFINFFLARHFGSSMVRKIIGDKNFDKYGDFLEKKNFNTLFALAIFSPVAPDDILCLFAGLTKMRIKTFALILIFLKPFALIAYTLGTIFALDKFSIFKFW